MHHPDLMVHRVIPLLQPVEDRVILFRRPCQLSRRPPVVCQEQATAERDAHRDTHKEREEEAPKELLVAHGLVKDVADKFSIPFCFEYCSGCHCGLTVQTLADVFVRRVVNSLNRAELV